jgi:hypothetical protein
MRSIVATLFALWLLDATTPHAHERADQTS